jgi:hypothetical protein
MADPEQHAGGNPQSTNDKQPDAERRCNQDWHGGRDEVRSHKRGSSRANTAKADNHVEGEELAAAFKRPSKRAL